MNFEMKFELRTVHLVFSDKEPKFAEGRVRQCKKYATRSSQVFGLQWLTLPEGLMILDSKSYYTKASGSRVDSYH